MIYECNDPVYRILGLSTIIQFDCNYWYQFTNPDIEWPLYANPLAILLLFQVWYPILINNISLFAEKRTTTESDLRERNITKPWNVKVAVSIQ